LSGCQLNQIGGKEMAGDEEVEHQPSDDILSAVVMAAEAD
jgi:hypothetical protein